MKNAILYFNNFVGLLEAALITLFKQLGIFFNHAQGF